LQYANTQSLSCTNEDRKVHFNGLYIFPKPSLTVLNKSLAFMIITINCILFQLIFHTIIENRGCKCILCLPIQTNPPQNGRKDSFCANFRTLEWLQTHQCHRLLTDVALFQCLNRKVRPLMN